MSNPYTDALSSIRSKMSRKPKGRTSLHGVQGVDKTKLIKKDMNQNRLSGQLKPGKKKPGK